MKITFTHNGHVLEIPISGQCEVKLYSVPTAYSSDGYFAAVWAGEELEPIPACTVNEAHLLTHVKAVQPLGAPVLTLQPVLCAEGVSYA